MNYTHLTYEQRYQIKILLEIGKTQQEIAKAIKVHRSTISRELRRNRGGRGYRPKQAHQFAIHRRKANGFQIGPLQWKVAEALLKLDWSPEQISGTLNEIGVRINHESIYLRIYADKRNGGSLWKNLRQQKKYRKRSSGRDRRGQIPDRVWIDKRPKDVEARKRLGDWEGDTIIGAKHKGAVLTLVDRKSGYTLMAPMEKREAKLVVLQAEKLFARMPYKKTLTVDNGKEFAKHKDIKDKAKIDVYFAHPYSSWERGTNENTNGLIRQYLPKIRRLDNVTENECKFIMNRLNNRPRKRLNWRTPHEVYYHECVALQT